MNNDSRVGFYNIPSIVFPIPIRVVVSNFWIYSITNSILWSKLKGGRVRENKWRDMRTMDLNLLLLLLDILEMGWSPKTYNRIPNEHQFPPHTLLLQLIDNHPPVMILCKTSLFDVPLDISGLNSHFNSLISSRYSSGFILPSIPSGKSAIAL